jgi:hypothetical protein
VLFSYADTSTTSLDVGYFLLGFAGPAIQLPTLHLARLFPGEAKEGGSGAAALLMSAQAGAFDGGTMVFAIFSLVANVYGLTSQTFFRFYLIVPFCTLLTAIFYWPNTILPDEVLGEEDGSFVGVSPYLGLSSRGSVNFALSSRNAASISLQDAPVSTILSKPPFYCLSIWVAVHILKLNFVVATINYQLAYNMEEETASTLINIFGAMLPFGFVVLPIVAYLLHKSTIVCFQLANVIGLIYGSVLAFFPGVVACDVSIVFVSVAISRQMVYSTVFHQTGELFGFANYGVLIGLTNVVASIMSLIQGPLVEWAQRNGGDYFGPNCVLLAATLPLFFIVYGTRPPQPASGFKSPGGRNNSQVASEKTSILELDGAGRPRAYSDLAATTLY